MINLNKRKDDFLEKPPLIYPKYELPPALDTFLDVIINKEVERNSDLDALKDLTYINENSLNKITKLAERVGFSILQSMMEKDKDVRKLFNTYLSINEELEATNKKPVYLRKEGAYTTLITDDMIVIRNGYLIGDGRCKWVYNGVNLFNGKPLALATVANGSDPNDEIDEEKYIDETKYEAECLIKIHENYPNPNIIKPYFTFETLKKNGDPKLIVISELYQGELEISNRLTSEMRLSIILQLMNGYSVIHKSGLAYNDFGYRNCFMNIEGDKVIAHVADLGFCKVFEDEKHVKEDLRSALSMMLAILFQKREIECTYFNGFVKNIETLKIEINKENQKFPINENEKKVLYVIVGALTAISKDDFKISNDTCTKITDAIERAINPN